MLDKPQMLVEEVLQGTWEHTKGSESLTVENLCDTEPYHVNTSINLWVLKESTSKPRKRKRPRCELDLWTHSSPRAEKGRAPTCRAYLGGRQPRPRNHSSAREHSIQYVHTACIYIYIYSVLYFLRTYEMACYTANRLLGLGACDL